MIAAVGVTKEEEFVLFFGTVVGGAEGRVFAEVLLFLGAVVGRAEVC